MMRAIVVFVLLVIAIPAKTQELDSSLITIVDSVIGSKKKRGGTSPNGFDCSGFTQYVYLQLGIQLPRRVIQQVKAGFKVDNPQPGDLMFFMDRGSLTHVGLFIGDNKMAHVSYAKEKVVVVPLERYWYKRLAQIRRVHPSLAV
jgi:cell wall-associated NlpC family hydrolase